MLITFVQLFIMMTYYLLLVVIASYAMGHFQATPSQAGLAGGIFLIGGVISRIFSGKWVEIIGRKKMLLLGLVFCLLFSISYFWVNSIPTLLLVRFFHGAAFAVSSTGWLTIGSHIIPKARYGEGIAYFMTSGTLATALGPFLGMMFIQYLSYNHVFGLSILFTVLGLVSALLTTVHDIKLTPEELDSLKGFKLSGYIELKAAPIAAMSGLLYMCYASVLSFLPTYAQEIQVVKAASFFFMIYACVILLSRPFMGRLYDIKGENTIMYPMIVVFAAGLLLLSQTTAGFILLSAAVLMGLGLGSVQACAQTIVVKAAPQHRKGMANSTFFLFVDLGIGIGPYLFGTIIPVIGYRGLYVAVSVFSLACVLLYHFVHGRKVFAKQN